MCASLLRSCRSVKRKDYIFLFFEIFLLFCNRFERSTQNTERRMNQSSQTRCKQNNPNANGMDQSGTARKRSTLREHHHHHHCAPGFKNTIFGDLQVATKPYYYGRSICSVIFKRNWSNVPFSMSGTIPYHTSRSSGKINCLFFNFFFK